MSQNPVPIVLKLGQLLKRKRELKKLINFRRKPKTITSVRKTSRLRPIKQLLAPTKSEQANITQQSVPDQIENNSTQDINYPLLRYLQYLDSITYRIEIAAEMQRRIECLATLKYKNHEIDNLLRRVPHLPNDIQISWKINHEILINHRSIIAFRDRAQYDQYKGFMFEQIFEQMQLLTEEKKIAQDTPVPEYSDRTPIMLTSDTYCTHCKIGHNKGTAPCHGVPVIKNMTTAQLKLDHVWRTTCKAIIISNKALVKLPASLQGVIINIQLPDNLTYEAEQDSNSQTDKESDLYREVMEILLIIGLKCTFPIFIEFLTPYQKTTAPEYHHTAFVRICKEIQNRYGGLIIPVLGLHMPNRNESTEKYQDNKRRLIPCTIKALALGRWLGVAIDVPSIQNTSVQEEQNRKLSPTWHNEPLFNMNAEPTREWYRRIAIYLSERINQLSPYYPLTNTKILNMASAAYPYAAHPINWP